MKALKGAGLSISNAGDVDCQAKIAKCAVKQ